MAQPGVGEVGRGAERGHLRAFELYELYLGFSWLKLAALTINVAIVAYMGHSIRQQRT
jgi:uncharacterized membrane protein (DUF2068 family)